MEHLQSIEASEEMVGRALASAIARQEKKYGEAYLKFHENAFTDEEKDRIKGWMLELAPMAAAYWALPTDSRRAHDDRSYTLLTTLGPALPHIVRNADERFALCRAMAESRMAQGTALSSSEAYEWLTAFGFGNVAVQALLPMLDLHETGDHYSHSDARLAMTLARSAALVADSPEGPIPGLIEALDRMTAPVRDADLHAPGSWAAAGRATPGLLRARVDAGLFPHSEAVSIINGWWTDPALWTVENRDTLHALGRHWLPPGHRRMIPPSVVFDPETEELERVETMAMPSGLRPITEAEIRDARAGDSEPAWHQRQRPSSSGPGH